ncbi:MAG: 4-(cytidine 5'-diphospho)-2-C-methyl-D-erythritol kinase [Planctomycetes bacterium]|nr:4-(cytidine 5'-diphospho)-2-C-methyl-D-erythritol kinase [Planctomycetota bacterium]
MLFRHVPSALVVHAPAKLNLFLEVLGKRPDGYHELETLMVTVGLYDTLFVTETDSGEIRLRTTGATGDPAAADGLAVPHDERNLVVRAARLLQQAAGARGGARIVLHKRIPAGSGLAGGSSDAAAALAALNRLWGLGLPAEELRRLAAELGSDVPFFLVQAPAAVCRGRGERIEPVRLPEGLWFVVVRPRSGLSTSQVFSHCRLAEQKQSTRPLVEALHRGRLDRAARHFHNALYEPAASLNPEVAQLRDWLRSCPVAGDLMSGSGSACFALCRHGRLARRLAARARAERLGSAWAVRLQT